MVLSTNDSDALDEVWFVLSKAIGSGSNSEIRSALKYVSPFLAYRQNCGLSDQEHGSALPQHLHTPFHAQTERNDPRSDFLVVLTRRQRERPEAPTTCTS